MDVPDTITYKAATRLLGAGISNIPVATDGTKKPLLPTWKEYQTRLPDADEIKRWYANGAGIAVLAGAVSGGLQIQDFDKVNLCDLYEEAAREHGFGALIDKVLRIRTPSGGDHFWYRCDGAVLGNRKLAHGLFPVLPDTEVKETNGRKQGRIGKKFYPILVLDGKEMILKEIVETRGEGGYAVAPPSDGYTLIRGKLSALPVLTVQEVATLERLCGLFNEYHDPKIKSQGIEITGPRSSGLGDMPGEAYNQTDAYYDVLRGHGWTLISVDSQKRGTWRRPGKDNGISATSNFKGFGGLYVFSTNAHPFESEKSYTPFGVYAFLEHDGDFKAAAQALAPMYGTRTEKKKTARPRRNTEGTEEEGTNGQEKLTPDELARLWSSKVRDEICYVEGAQWWEYAGNVWRYSSEDIARRLVQEFLAEHSGVTAARVREVLFLAQQYLGPVRVSQFNARKDWIPLRNGVYDVSSGTLVPHDPTHFLTYQAPFEYQEDADCPTWRECLQQWMLTDKGDPFQEWINIVQEWFGLCLVPDATMQTAMFWVGEGGNGKGVATALLEGLVGRESCTVIPIEMLHDPYHRAELQGKLVGFVNEIDPKAMVKNASQFKAIVAGDPLSARRPTEKVFTFTPTCRVVISMNELPSTRDLSRGYFRRVNIIEWRNNIPEGKRDPGLAQKLQRELPGIFNWALEGLHRVRAQNGLTQSAESKRLLEAYKRSEDPIGRFFEECLVFDKTEYTPARDLYRKYKAWCEEAGCKAETEHYFGRRLDKAKCVQDRKYCTTDEGKERVRVWRGVRLRTIIDDQNDEDLSEYTV